MINIGKEIFELCNDIYPVYRCLTGDGVRKTLKLLDRYIYDGIGIHLNIHEVPSGEEIFDWIVPKEWRIKEAYIENEEGERIVDFSNNNLCIVGYSTDIDTWLDLEELKKHIYVQENQPDVIPYVTSYYRESFGFCMSCNQRKQLKPGNYHVYIDSELFDGNLTYADLIIPGKSEKEIMFTSYICHPSMADDNCSGPALLAGLIKYVAGLQNRKYTYRFVLNPETIGALIYIKHNMNKLKKNVIAGVVLSCVGDNNGYSMVESRYADTLADRILSHLLEYGKIEKYKKYSFLKRASDERQYNSPGIDLPIVCFCRSKFGEFPEYHTSADNMDFVSPEGFDGSYNLMKNFIDIVENNCIYQTKILGEPQLGKRGMYPTTSRKGIYQKAEEILNVIAYADGKNDLVDIGNQIGICAVDILCIIEELIKHNIVEKEYEFD